MHELDPAQNKILVAILNWNGWEDTIACCKSIAACESTPLDILVLDNNSSDNSAGSIREFISQNSLPLQNIKTTSLGHPVTIEQYKSHNSRYHFYPLPENTGFAKGFNIATKYAKDQGYTYILILNNDTTIDRDAIGIMLQAAEQQTADIIIPQIRYFDSQDTIWNCGGKISRWGKTNYNYAGMNGDTCKLPEHLQVEFATGCCMLVRTDYFIKIGGFTEKFFFGEEDVELSFRLKKLGGRAICVTRSIIFHKVGASIKGDPKILSRKAFIHYLNRIINMRDQMPMFTWHIWRLFTLTRAAFTFKTKYKRHILEVGRISRILLRDSYNLNGVSKEYFQKTLKQGIGIESN